MIKAILFDLDNTLIDFMKIKKASCSSAVSAMIKAGLKTNRRKALKVLYELYDKYGIEYQYIFQRFLKKYRREVDYKILTAGIDAYRKKQLTMQKPYPQVISTLKKLRKKGLKLAIVSDAPRLKAWTRLTELGIQDYFDVVVTHGDSKARKPSKLPFEKALKVLKVKPEECLMVGDNPERDIIGAKRLGMKTCFAKYGWNEKNNDITCDYVIREVGALINILK